MQDKNKTKKQLIQELEKLRNQVEDPKNPDIISDTLNNKSDTSIPFDVIFDAIPDIIGIQNTEHEIICYNKAGYDFLKVSPEEVKGKKCFELIGREKPCEICATSKVYETKKPAQVQKYIDSMGVWLDVRAYPVLDKNGRLTKVIEHLRDITTEKEMERQVLKSHQKLEQHVEERTSELEQEKNLMKKYLDVSGTIILAMDCELNITLVNKKGCEILGYNKDEITGRSIFDFIPKRYKADINTVSQKLLNREFQTAQHFENPVITRSGEERIISWHNTVLEDDSGNITGTLSSGMDITERKLAENRKEYLNQVLRAIRNVNQLITQEKNRDQLIQKACKSLVETRGYHKVWIGLMDENDNFSYIVQSGMGDDISYIKNRLENGYLIDCVQKALEHSGTIVTNDPVSTCVNCPLPDIHKGDTLTTRLEYNNRIYGILSVTVPSDYGTDKEELELFEELSGDISYALYNLELEDEKTRTYNKLQQSLKQYQDVFNGMNDAAFVHDLEGYFLDVNDIAVQRLGYSREELLSMGPKDIDDKKSQIMINDYIDQIEDKGSLTFEAVHVTKTGKKIPVSISSSIIDYDGKTAILSIARDITERKEMEKALKESEKYYRTIFETTGSATAIADENTVFLLVNKEFEELSGYSKEEIENKKSWVDFIAEEDLLYLKDNYCKLLNEPSEVPKKYEFRFIDRDGKQKYISMAVSSIPERKIAIATLLDITERKKAEKTLEEYSEKLSKANEELRTLDKMKNEFISNLNHELRTPITSIKGYSELIYNEKLGSLNKKQKESMDAVVRSCERLRQLIESLLYINKLQTEKTQYRFNPLDMKNIIDDVVSSSYLQIKEKDLSVEKYIDDNLSYISGDIGYLKQVLMHLVDNARKFTSSGGKIQVYAFEDIDKNNRKYVHIVLRDDGIGIKKDMISDIFKLFYQIDGSMTRKYGGTGLGMYLCEKIIETHGGHIWVESEENKGTDVHIRLPAVQNNS